MRLTCTKAKGRLKTRLFILIVMLATSVAHARSFVSTAAGGNWATNTTWTVGGVAATAANMPITSADDVTIATTGTGTVVFTASTTNACNSLTVSNTGTGGLLFNVASVTLAVANNVTINTGATLAVSGSAAASTLTVGGSFTMNGGTYTGSLAATVGAINTAITGSLLIGGAATASTFVSGTTTSCSNLTIAALGILQLGQGGIVRTLTCSGDVLINLSGSLLSGTSGTAANVLNIGGNLTNNGIFNAIATTANTISTTFTGAASNTFTSSAASTTSFYQITVNKGVDSTSVLDFNPDPASAVTFPTAINAVTLTKGTLKMSSGGATPNFPAFLNTFAAGSKLWLNNANISLGWAIVLGNINGSLQIDNGTFNVGAASTIGSFQVIAGGGIIMNGGAINCNGSVLASGFYVQTGGVVTTSIVGNTSANGSFATNSLSMSGGKIVIQNPNTNAVPTDFAFLSGGFFKVTAGSLQFGNASTLPTPAPVFRTKGIKTPNIVLDNSSGNNPSLVTIGAVTVYGDITLNGAGSFTKGDFNITMYGCSAANPGNIIVNGTNALTLTGTTVASSLQFGSAGWGSQALTLGNGSIVNNEIGSLYVNNIGGATVTIPSGLAISNAAAGGNVFLVLNKGTLVVGSGGTGTIQFGSSSVANVFQSSRNLAAIQGAASTLSAKVTKTYYSYLTTASNAVIAPGLELPTNNSTMRTLTVNMTATDTLILNKNILIDSALVLTSGIVNTTPTNLLILSGTCVASGKATSYINGPAVRNYTANGTGGATAILPLGKNGLYLPCGFNPIGGAVQMQAEAFTGNPKAYGDANGNLGSYYWKMSMYGGATSGFNVPYIPVLSFDPYQPTVIDSVLVTPSLTGNWKVGTLADPWWSNDPGGTGSASATFLGSSSVQGLIGGVGADGLNTTGMVFTNTPLYLSYGTCTTPAAPTGAATQDLSGTTSPNVSNLIVTPFGTTYSTTWYDAAIGGNVVAPTTALPKGTTHYYASQTTPNGCESSSRLDVAAINGTVLPLALLSFTGMHQANGNQLSWKTAAEVNTAKFVVESSSNGTSFTTIGQVVAVGSGNNSYGFTDAGTNGTVLYRLKMMDVDGKFTYSNTLMVTGNSSVNVTVSPNPARDVLYINGLSTNNKLSLVDMNGKLLASVTATGTAQAIDISSYAKGIYVLRVATISGTITNVKVIKE